MLDGTRKTILNIMMNLELAHDEMSQLPQSYKRDDAYELIEQAHKAVSLLLVTK